MRNYQKIKELSDYKQLDIPETIVGIDIPHIPQISSVMILRTCVCKIR